MTASRSTVYVCTDQGQHRAARLGQWNDEQSERIRFAVESGQSPHTDWDFDRYAPPRTTRVGGTRESVPTPSTIDLTTGGGTATLRCPRCRREKRLRVERLDAALEAGVERVDISRI